MMKRFITRLAGSKDTDADIISQDSPQLTHSDQGYPGDSVVKSSVSPHLYASSHHQDDFEGTDVDSPPSQKTNYEVSPQSATHFSNNSPLSVHVDNSGTVSSPPSISSLPLRKPKQSLTNLSQTPSTKDSIIHDQNSLSGTADTVIRSSAVLVRSRSSISKGTRYHNSQIQSSPTVKQHGVKTSQTDSSGHYTGPATLERITTEETPLFRESQQLNGCQLIATAPSFDIDMGEKLDDSGDFDSSRTMEDTGSVSEPFRARHRISRNNSGYHPTVVESSLKQCSSNEVYSGVMVSSLSNLAAETSVLRRNYSSKLQSSELSLPSGFSQVHEEDEDDVLFRPEDESIMEAPCYNPITEDDMDLYTDTINHFRQIVKERELKKPVKLDDLPKPASKVDHSTESTDTESLTASSEFSDTSCSDDADEDEEVSDENVYPPSYGGFARPSVSCSDTVCSPLQGFVQSGYLPNPSCPKSKDPSPFKEQYCDLTLPWIHRNRILFRSSIGHSFHSSFAPPVDNKSKHVSTLGDFHFSAKRSPDNFNSDTNPATGTGLWLFGPHASAYCHKVNSFYSARTNHSRHRSNSTQEVIDKPRLNLTSQNEMSYKNDLHRRCTLFTPSPYASYDIIRSPFTPRRRSSAETRPDLFRLSSFGDILSPLMKLPGGNSDSETLDDEPPVVRYAKEGIPVEDRWTAWFALSGAADLCQSHPIGYYSALCWSYANELARWNSITTSLQAISEESQSNQFVNRHFSSTPQSETTLKLPSVLESSSEAKSLSTNEYPEEGSKLAFVGPAEEEGIVYNFTGLQSFSSFVKSRSRSASLSQLPEPTVASGRNSPLLSPQPEEPIFSASDLNQYLASSIGDSNHHGEPVKTKASTSVSSEISIESIDTDREAFYVSLEESPWSVLASETLPDFPLVRDLAKAQASNYFAHHHLSTTHAMTVKPHQRSLDLRMQSLSECDEEDLYSPVDKSEKVRSVATSEGIFSSVSEYYRSLNISGTSESLGVNGFSEPASNDFQFDKCPCAFHSSLRSKHENNDVKFIPSLPSCTCPEKLPTFEKNAFGKSTSRPSSPRNSSSLGCNQNNDISKNSPLANPLLNPFRPACGCAFSPTRPPPSKPLFLLADEEILKDITRTFPEHPFFRTSQGLLRLYRILTALSVRLEDSVGYCQSLNFLAGALLIGLLESATKDFSHTNPKSIDDLDTIGLYPHNLPEHIVDECEEKAFWLLCVLVESRPGYYSRSLCGIDVDCAVLTSLLDIELPRTAYHLRTHEISSSVFGVTWLLTQGVTPLGLEGALRLWDLLFVVGEETLFHLAIALLYSLEDTLLALPSTEEILQAVLHDSVGKKFRSKLDCVIRKMPIGAFGPRIAMLRTIHSSAIISKNLALSPGVAKKLSGNFNLVRLFFDATEASLSDHSSGSKSKATSNSHTKFREGKDKDKDKDKDNDSEKDTSQQDLLRTLLSSLAKQRIYGTLSVTYPTRYSKLIVPQKNHPHVVREVEQKCETKTKLSASDTVPSPSNPVPMSIISNSTDLNPSNNIGSSTISSNSQYDSSSLSNEPNTFNTTNIIPSPSSPSVHKEKDLALSKPKLTLETSGLGNHIVNTPTVPYTPSNAIDSKNFNASPTSFFRENQKTGTKGRGFRSPKPTKTKYQISRDAQRAKESNDKQTVDGFGDLSTIFHTHSGIQYGFTLPIPPLASEPIVSFSGALSTVNQQLVVDTLSSGGIPQGNNGITNGEPNCPKVKKTLSMLIAGDTPGSVMVEFIVDANHEISCTKENPYLAPQEVEPAVSCNRPPLSIDVPSVNNTKTVVSLSCSLESLMLTKAHSAIQTIIPTLPEFSGLDSNDEKSFRNITEASQENSLSKQELIHSESKPVNVQNDDLLIPGNNSLFDSSNSQADSDVVAIPYIPERIRSRSVSMSDSDSSYFSQASLPNTPSNHSLYQSQTDSIDASTSTTSFPRSRSFFGRASISSRVSHSFPESLQEVEGETEEMELSNITYQRQHRPTLPHSLSLKDLTQNIVDRDVNQAEMHSGIPQYDENDIITYAEKPDSCSMQDIATEISEKITATNMSYAATSLHNSSLTVASLVDVTNPCSWRNFYGGIPVLFAPGFATLCASIAENSFSFSSGSSDGTGKTDIPVNIALPNLFTSDYSIRLFPHLIHDQRDRSIQISSEKETIPNVLWSFAEILTLSGEPGLNNTTTKNESTNLSEVPPLLSGSLGLQSPINITANTSPTSHQNMEEFALKDVPTRNSLSKVSRREVLQAVNRSIASLASVSPNIASLLVSQRTRPAPTLAKALLNAVPISSRQAVPPGPIGLFNTYIILKTVPELDIPSSPVLPTLSLLTTNGSSSISEKSPSLTKSLSHSDPHINAIAQTPHSRGMDSTLSMSNSTHLSPSVPQQKPNAFSTLSKRFSVFGSRPSNPSPESSSSRSQTDSESSRIGSIDFVSSSGFSSDPTRSRTTLQRGYSSYSQRPTGIEETNMGLILHPSIAYSVHGLSPSTVNSTQATSSTALRDDSALSNTMSLLLGPRSRRDDSQVSFLAESLVQALWNNFLSISPWSVLVSGGIMDICTFSRIFIPLAFSHRQRKRWASNDLAISSGVAASLFNAVNFTNSGNVSFEEFLGGLSILLAGTQRQRALFCYRYFDPHGIGVTPQMLCKGLVEMYLLFHGDVDGGTQALRQALVFIRQMYDSFAERKQQRAVSAVLAIHKEYYRRRLPSNLIVPHEAILLKERLMGNYSPKENPDCKEDNTKHPVPNIPAESSENQNDFVIGSLNTKNAVELKTWAQDSIGRMSPPIEKMLIGSDSLPSPKSDCCETQMAQKSTTQVYYYPEEFDELEKLQSSIMEMAQIPKNTDILDYDSFCSLISTHPLVMLLFGLEM